MQYAVNCWGQCVGVFDRYDAALEVADDLCNDDELGVLVTIVEVPELDCPATRVERLEG
jgi:hypothetical protein